MGISTIRGLGRCIRNYSGFSGRTVNSIIIALGFHPLHGTHDEFRELSKLLVNCTEHGSAEGYRRLFKYNEKEPFFKTHRQDIVSHMEQKAEEEKTDIISMVQDYFFTKRGRKPTAEAIGKALWDSRHIFLDLTPLYNYFTHYVLCEMSCAWYSYLEENPD